MGNPFLKGAKKIRGNKLNVCLPARGKYILKIKVEHYLPSKLIAVPVL